MKHGFSLKSFLPRSLLGRSLLILIVPVLLIQVITTYMFFDRHWNKMTTRLAFALSGEVAVISATMRDSRARAELAHIIRASEKYLDLHISFAANQKLPQQKEKFRRGMRVWEGAMARQLRSELSGQIKEPFEIHVARIGESIDVLVQLEDGVLKVSFPQRRLFSSSGYIFLLWMIGTSLLLLFVAMMFMRGQIRPIRKLAIAAERFGKGRDTPSFKPEGASEVRRAAHAFLDMRERIQRQISQRTDMLAGVSHDLRTPLTRMKLQLEMLPDSPDVRDLKRDIQDMEKMIHGYLDFVRGDGDEPVQNVDMEALCGKMAENLKRQGIIVDLDVQTGQHLTVRPLAFERALGNILANAAKYAGHVWIKVSLKGPDIMIMVEDNGPGIPPEYYEDVFKPFMRVDNSRNAQTGGVGLGLPIAMDIVHAHGGEIDLGKSGHGGLCVTIRLPV